MSSESLEVVRTMPVGAEVLPAGGTDFRVWAPAHKEVAIVVSGRTHPLTKDANGYFSAHLPEVEKGATYKYRIGDKDLPDPASRFQPEGPHGPSQVIDPKTFQWTDHGWSGVELS